MYTLIDSISDGTLKKLKYVKVKNKSIWVDSHHKLNTNHNISINDIFEVIGLDLSSDFPNSHGFDTVFITKQNVALRVKSCRPATEKELKEWNNE